MRVHLAAAVVATLVALAACAPRDGSGPPTSARTTAELPDAPPSITGVITALDGGRVRIEENPADWSGSAKAVVNVAGARIARRSGAAATAGDLAVGQRVSAWFTGPVAESYPVQARAEAVVIEADAEGDGATVVVRGDTVLGAGRVEHFTIEGGFYAIRGANGKVYDPINLPAEYHRDGLSVRFTARVRRDMGSIHMVGEIVELIDISRR